MYSSASIGARARAVYTDVCSVLQCARHAPSDCVDGTSGLCQSQLRADSEIGSSRCGGLDAVDQSLMNSRVCVCVRPLKMSTLLLLGILCALSDVGAAHPSPWLNRMDNSINSVSDSQCWTGPYPPHPNKAPPSYIIDLDLPPLYRYTQLMEVMAERIIKLLQLIRSKGPFIHGRGFRVVEHISGIIGSFLPYPFNDEIRGIALATGLKVGDITLMNIFYELSAFCTSIVAKDQQGRLHHGRNLDFGLFFGWDNVTRSWDMTEILRPLTVMLDYRRKNRTVFKTAGFAGMVGVLTGVRPGEFSMSIDERFTAKPGIWYMLKWALGARLQWNTIITRQVLENATSFTAAQSQLTSTPLIASAYFILSGVRAPDAVVITRGQYDADLWKFGHPSLSQDSVWYLLQTNYDHWKSPPFFDNRRGPGIRCMDRLGSANVSSAGLYSVLNTKPVLNKLTVYTSLMTPATGEMQVWLQKCQDPDCQLW